MISAYPAGVPSFGAAAIPQLFGSQAQCFFVDNTSSANGGLGNDGNDGKSPGSPVLTLARGYQLLRNGFNDTLYLIGTNTAYTLTATLLVAKNFVHFVGITTPLMVSPRVRITSGTATMASVVQVTGVGCSFRNLQIAQFGSSATLNAIAALVQGQRNYFANVHFAGGGNATARGDASMRSCSIDGQVGGGEHVFDECTFGLDTVDSAGANFEVELINEATRIYMNKCNFVRRTVAGGTTGAFINVPAAGMDRFLLLRDPAFMNFTLSGGSALGVAIFNNAASGGIIMLKNPLSFGCTKISTGTNIFADNAYAAATVGLGVNPS